MQWLSVADMDKPLGTITYTQLCNEQGGIECDLTMVRTATDAWYVVTGSAFGAHDMGWIRSHCPTDGSVQVGDVTSARGVVNLCGPLARDVLQAVCEEDVSNAAFRYGRARELTIGAAPVLALRIGYTGELGWELHVPTEYTAHVYDVLWRAGQQHGIVNAGYRAIDRLRVEKGYVYWSTDVTPDTTPLEAGLEWRIDWDKGDFCGRDALVAQRDTGVERRLCTFTARPERRPGTASTRSAVRRSSSATTVVGFTTTANFGDTIGKPIAYGYVPVEHLDRTDWVIEVYGEPIPATRHEGALYDPKGARLRA